MSKGELATIFGGGKVALAGDKAALAAALKQDNEEHGEGSGGGTGVGGAIFLNFSGKKGVYVLGKEKDDMDEDEMFVLMPESATRGWAAWKNSKVIKRHRWGVGEEGIAEEDLEDIAFGKGGSDGWSSERTFIAKSLDDGKQVEFSTTTVSARNSVGDLLGAVSDKMMSGSDATYPIFCFDREEFTAHDQKNFKPTFPIKGWATMEELVAYENEELELDDILSDEDDKPAAIESKSKKKDAPKKRRRASL
jgi:hypothetical protein